MVLWHNLVPLVQLLANVGYLGQMYLERLHDDWKCDYEEMWMDPTRGVVCRGPKGPYSYIPVYGLRYANLPPTAELLQEAVLVRFLASHKSKEADDAFMYAMYCGWNDEDVHERVDQPTIFSDLTKTPIAVANNLWESKTDTLVDQTCLENGWTRFQLDGDGRLDLRLNSDIGKAWLSQALSIFHTQGVSLEDDREDFSLVHPWGWLDGYLDDSPSKCQQRRQQAIYLFVYPPPSYLRDGETSSFHHWSFHEDGQPQLSPELCCDLGLPVRLDFGNNFSAFSWSTDDYKFIRQYRTLQGFDPTTNDFARRLGYGHDFRPLDDEDRFEDVYEDETSPSPQAPTSPGGSPDMVDSEYPSNMPDQIRAEDMVSVGNLHEKGDEYTKTSYLIVPNKRRRTGLELGGIEACNHQHHDFRHNLDHTSDEQVGTGAGLRPMRPLSIRNPPFTGISQPHFIQQDTLTSQLQPLHDNPSDNQISRRYPFLPIDPSPRDILAPYNSNMSTPGIPNSFSLPTHTIFDTTPLFGPYIASDDTHPVIDHVPSGINPPYSDPSAYSVATATEYDANAGHGFGWSWDQRSETPEHRSGPSFIAPNSGAVLDSYYPAFTPTVSYPSHSYVHPPYSSYDGVASPPGYPSSFLGSSIGPQRDWNCSFIHSQPPPVPSHSWVRPGSTPLYSQLGYGESSEGGRNGDSEGWF
ncbi:hypothetical protein PM082_014840 [Marasmius tenuissimus]|nr:hypothetical protein PM082_014840 [Marasmius tenuissimus]